MPAPSQAGGPPLHSPNRSANADYSRGRRRESYRCCRDTLTGRRTSRSLHWRGLGPVYLLSSPPSIPILLPHCTVWVTPDWETIRTGYLNCTHLGCASDQLSQSKVVIKKSKLIKRCGEMRESEWEMRSTHDLRGSRRALFDLDCRNMRKQLRQVSNEKYKHFKQRGNDTYKNKIHFIKRVNYFWSGEIKMIHNWSLKCTA